MKTYQTTCNFLVDDDWKIIQKKFNEMDRKNLSLNSWAIFEREELAKIASHGYPWNGGQELYLELIEEKTKEELMQIVHNAYTQIVLKRNARKPA